MGRKQWLIGSKSFPAFAARASQTKASRAPANVGTARRKPWAHSRARRKAKAMLTEEQVRAEVEKRYAPWGFIGYINMLQMPDRDYDPGPENLAVWAVMAQPGFFDLSQVERDILIRKAKS